MKLKIGIFDSGIGGFTILNSLLKTRKDVEVFYLADIKRIPFGNKNSKEIRLIAEEICTFFIDKNLDALLVACNTTNACALDILEDKLKDNDYNQVLILQYFYLIEVLNINQKDNLTYRNLAVLFQFLIQILDILAEIFSYSLF